MVGGPVVDAAAGAAVLVAVVAAVRSTWSPCGLSMLATITPLAEQGRGHRYRATAAWFVLGSVLGGASLGGAMALLAAGVRALGLPVLAVGLVAVAATAMVVASDAGLGGRWSLPVHHRQVNERWLDQFRPWVYGAGFGWQVGCGLATYVMTGGVYLTVVLGALTGRPVLALAIGVVFGTVRGLAVLLGRGITTPEGLRAFHRRFFGAGPVVAAAVVVVESVVLLSLGSVAVAGPARAHPWAVGLVVALALGAAGPAMLSTARGAAVTPAGCRTDRGGRATGAEGERTMEQRTEEPAVAGGRPAGRGAGRLAGG